MLTIKNGFAPEVGGGDSGTGGGAVNLIGILSVLRRQWPVVVVGVAVMLAAAIAYLALATPLWTATASVMLDTRQNQLLQSQKLMAEGAVDASEVDSQVEVVGSDRLAIDVIRKLHLDQDPEFVGPPTGIKALIQPIIGGIKQMLGAEGGTPVTPERSALDLFSTRLDVKRVGLTYVLTISYTSQDPLKSERIANAVAQAYVEDDLRAKYDATKRASAWLQDRLAALRGQATAADQAVQSFKSQNNLVDTSRGAMTEQQLAELNTQLITAKSDTAQAKARLDRVSEIQSASNPGATVSDALASPVVSRLRAQFLDLQSQVSQFSQRFGANHQATVNLRNQMEDVRKSIQDELKRLGQSYESDYEIAKAREASLTASLAQVVGTQGVNSEAQVKLRDLESTAETNRALYDSFLQMARQTTQQETFPVSDTRILADAATPLIRSSPPKTIFVLFGAIMMGGVLGAAAAFGREFLVDAFRTSSDVERETGVPCLGFLPTVDVPGSRSLRGRHSVDRVSSFVLDAPFSRFTETMRHVKVSIDLSRLSHANKVIGVTSAIPREGKSMVAANLAHLLASLGHSALLIDGDLHARSLTGAIAKDAKVGLLEALERPEQLSQFVVKQKRSQLDFLPAPVAMRLPHAADIIASSHMGQLLDVARARYDYVIVDLPPVVPVVDAKAAAHLMDSFLFVIDWGRTTKTVILEALASAEVIRERVIGTVLNKADPAALKRIESYKGRAFHEYYIEPGQGSAQASNSDRMAV